MSPRVLENYLDGHIPLSRAMEVSVVSVDEDVAVLRAPLAPNVNHRDGTGSTELPAFEHQLPAPRRFRSPAAGGAGSPAAR